MLHNFKPTWKINTIFHITPQQVKALNKKGLIVDIDNTLLPWYEQTPTEQVTQWIDAMQQSGIVIFLVSNNTTERVSKVAAPLGLPFSSNSLKPSAKGFVRAQLALKLPKESLLVIGDQLVTDIHGANKQGLDCVLVKQLSRHDIIYTLPNRVVEGIICMLTGIHKREDWGNHIG